MATSLAQPNSSSSFLDNGAGSGMLTSLILESFPGADVTAADISPGMIDSLKTTAEANAWRSVRSLVVDASDLGAGGLKDATFTHSLGTFFLPFVSDPLKVILEMKRVTKTGGVIAVSTWSRVSWVEIWEKAVRETLDSNYIAPALFHIGTTELEDIQKLFETAGLRNIQVKTFPCPHPRKASVEAATDEFMNMGNPSTKLLQKGLDEEQLALVRPAFARAYAAKYDGVKNPQKEIAVLAVGKR